MDIPRIGMVVAIAEVGKFRWHFEIDFGRFDFLSLGRMKFRSAPSIPEDEALAGIGTVDHAGLAPS